MERFYIPFIFICYEASLLDIRVNSNFNIDFSQAPTWSNNRLEETNRLGEFYVNIRYELDKDLYE